MEKNTFVIASAIVIFGAIYGGQTQTCETNQVYDYCGTSCPNYCHKDNDPPICNLLCNEGCRCDTASGYIRQYIDSDVCVLNTTCVSVEDCGYRKTYYTCGTACPDYCGKPDGIMCTLQCVPGCQCKPGYVLANETSTDCIPSTECPP